MIAVALVVFTLSILMWVALGRRFGKSHPVAIGSLLLGIGTSAVYPMLPAGNIALPLVVSSIGLGSLSILHQQSAQAASPNPISWPFPVSTECACEHF